MQENAYEMHELLSEFTTVIIIIKFERVTGFHHKIQENYNKPL